jgi:hypothetical protein
VAFTEHTNVKGPLVPAWQDGRETPSASSREPTPSNKDLRIFAVVVATGFSILGSISWYRAGVPTPFAHTVWTIAAVLIVTGLVVPRALVPVHFVWVRVGHALGFVNTRILLGGIYYGLFTPIATFFRFRGRDPLQRRRRQDTYWVRRSPRQPDYTKQH